MKWYSALTRLGLGGVACWFTYQAFREHQTRRNIESEIARIEEELVSISPPRSNEIMVQIANPSKTFCSWLCYIPENKHAKIVLEQENSPPETLIDFGVNPNFRRLPIQLSVDAPAEASDKSELRPVLWGPNAAEKLLPMDPGFVLVKHEFFVESEQDRNDRATFLKQLNSRTGIGISKMRVRPFDNTNLRKNFRSVMCNPNSKVVLFRYVIERIVDGKQTSRAYDLTMIAKEVE